MTNMPHEAQAWLHKAEHDLTMAQRAMDPKLPLPDMACYHAQQCAEKSLKGFLMSRHERFALVHDLVYLLGLCIRIEPDFKSFLSHADVLNGYATRVRYPSDPQGDPTIAEAADAIMLTREVFDGVTNFLRV